MKICKKCKLSKDESEFNVNKRYKDGLESACRECYQLYQKEYYHKNRDRILERERNSYQKNPEIKKKRATEYRDKNYEEVVRKRKETYYKNPDKHREYYLKDTYGITLKYYEEMLKAQGGCCGVCKKHHSTLQRNLCVDHNHVTGKIRGLLCDNCNHGIGKLFADIGIETLYNAIEYIKKRDGI